MCINTKYSMSIIVIEKVFKYEETELSVIKRQDDTWFRGKTIAEILGYSNPLKAIRTHVDSEDKKEISKLEPKSRGAQNGHPFKNTQLGTIYVNESGVYSWCVLPNTSFETRIGMRFQMMGYESGSPSI